MQERLREIVHTAATPEPRNARLLSSNLNLYITILLRLVPNRRLLRHNNGHNITFIKFRTVYMAQNPFLRTISALCEPDLQ